MQIKEKDHEILMERFRKQCLEKEYFVRRGKNC